MAEILFLKAPFCFYTQSFWGFWITWLQDSRSISIKYSTLKYSKTQQSHFHLGSISSCFGSLVVNPPPKWGKERRLTKQLEIKHNFNQAAQSMSYKILLA